jgi:hypothetical protein
LRSDILDTHDILEICDPAQELGAHQVAVFHLVQGEDADIHSIRYVLEVLKNAFLCHGTQIKLGIDDAHVVGPNFLRIPAHLHCVLQRRVRGVRQNAHATVAFFYSQLENALAFCNCLVQRFALQRIHIHASELQAVDAIAYVVFEPFLIDFIAGSKRRQRSAPDASHILLGVIFCFRFAIFHFLSLMQNRSWRGNADV